MTPAKPENADVALQWLAQMIEDYAATHAPSVRVALSSTGRSCIATISAELKKVSPEQVPSNVHQDQ